MVAEKKAVIPLLDLAKYFTAREAFVCDLRHACHSVGFFLIRHDFQGVADSMLAETKEFFQCSLDQKQTISQLFPD